MNVADATGTGLLGHEDRLRIPAGACPQDRSDPRGKCRGERQARPAERGHLRRAEAAAHVAHLRRRGDRRGAAVADQGPRADRSHHLSQRRRRLGVDGACLHRRDVGGVPARQRDRPPLRAWHGEPLLRTGHADRDAEEGRRRLSAERQVVLCERHLPRHLHPHRGASRRRHRPSGQGRQRRRDRAVRPRPGRATTSCWATGMCWGCTPQAASTTAPRMCSSPTTWCSRS